MSDTHHDRDSSFVVTTFHYDPEGRLSFVEAPTLQGSSWEHDEAKRLFRITQPDGKTIEFHDRFLRFLVVAPDPETGKPEPVMSWGTPRILYLCREAGL